MRKVIIIIILLFSAYMIQAQETSSTASTSNDRLPVAGDIAFGIDALPYLNYLGNMFNNTVGNTLTLGSNNIYVRYFLSDDMAVRVIISVADNIIKNRTYVRDDAAFFQNPLSQDKVIDLQKIHNQNYGLTLGIMKTRGYERVRGIYGAQLQYTYGRSQIEYEYGNEMTVANPAPSSIWGNTTERPLLDDEGYTQSIGGGVFLGVEYYFLPKICIGGEASLMINYQWSSQENIKSELIQNGVRFERDIPVSPGNKRLGINTLRPATYAGLYVMFHF